MSCFTVIERTLSAVSRHSSFLYSDTSVSPGWLFYTNSQKSNTSSLTSTSNSWPCFIFPLGNRKNQRKLTKFMVSPWLSTSLAHHHTIWKGRSFPLFWNTLSSLAFVTLCSLLISLTFPLPAVTGRRSERLLGHYKAFSFLCSLLFPADAYTLVYQLLIIWV